MKRSRGVLVFQLVVFFACLFPSCFGVGLLPNSVCDNIEIFKLHYKNYYDLYLGNTIFLAEIREDGIYVQVLRKAVASCCPNTEIEFSFIAPGKTEMDIEELVLNHVLSSRDDGKVLNFYYPEFADKKARTVYDSQTEFVRLSRSPGHAIIMKKPPPNPPVFVGEIFVKSWAIMIFLIAFAWIIGILAWMADHYRNPKEFPNPFYVGMFEGFWWSVVTMTTVGYGDKSPRSNLARVLAVIWIMISTVFLSLFTANATSILQISQAEEDHSLTLGKKIGVLNSKHFVEFELNLGAQITNFDTTLGLVMALDANEINRMIFPNYLDFLIFSSYPEYQSTRDTFELTNVLDHPFQIGMVLARNSLNLTSSDTNFLLCLRAIIPSFEKQQRGSFDLSTIQWVADSKEEKTALDNDNLLLMTYYFFIIIVVLVVFGLSFDAYKYYKKTHPQHQAADEEMVENPIMTDSIHEIPSRQSSPTMQQWGAEASEKYKMTTAENPSDPANPEACDCESFHSE